MTNKAVLALASCVVLCATVHGQRAPDLDTRFLPRPVSIDPVGGIAIPASAPPRGPGLVAVRLVAISPSACNWEETVTYDVEIQNVSGQTVTVPWSLTPPSAPVADQLPAVFPILSVSLRVGEGKGGWFGEGEALYGDPADSFTVRRLEPGSSVVIRLATTCEVLNSPTLRIGHSESIALAVFAQALFKNGETQVGAIVTSNHVGVNIWRQ